MEQHSFEAVVPYIRKIPGRDGSPLICTKGNFKSSQFQVNRLEKRLEKAQPPAVIRRSDNKKEVIPREAKRRERFIPRSAHV